MAAYRYQLKIPQDTITMPTIQQRRHSPETKPHTPEHTGPHHATETSLLHYAGDLDVQLDYHRMSPHRLSRERHAAEDTRQPFTDCS